MAESARIYPIGPRAPGDVPVGTIVAPTGMPQAPAPSVGAAVSATAPTNPVMGMFWWDTTNHRLMLYIGSWMQV